MKGKNHKEDCQCRLCKGEAGFQKNNKLFVGKNNHMFGKKRNCPWISEKNKKQIGNLNPFYGKHHTEAYKEKSRKRKQLQIIMNGEVKYGKNEKDCLDNIEKLFKIKIIRQYPVNGYFVDGYCKEKNMVFEVYEKFHERQRTKDKKREDFIINKLKCKFLRIKDY